MDETQIQELIDSAIAAKLEANNTTLLGEIDRRNSGTAASIKRDLAKMFEDFQTKSQQATSATETTNPETPPETVTGQRPTVKGVDLQTQAIQKELQDLQKELAAERQAKFNSDRNSALLSLISSSGVIPATQNVVKDVLLARYGANVKTENGEWYLESSDGVVSLNSVVDNFLKTPEGMAFLPATGTRGASSSESGKAVTPTGELSLEEMISQAVI